MADLTKIQWTDATWNPWHGCTKVGPGCKYCYMYRDKERYGQDATTVLRSKTKFNEPLKWHEPKRVFTCSWSDFFHADADAWRKDAWDVIRQTPHLTYQILTKRPERILNHLPSDWGKNGYDNVWLGVTGENEEMTFKRVQTLLGVPAKVRFLSAEPLLDDITSERVKPLISELDWVIIGGESGNKSGLYRYRPMDLKWAENIIDVCFSSNIPVFMKQLGTYQSDKLNLQERHGGNPSEWPSKLQVRQFPV